MFLRWHHTSCDSLQHVHVLIIGQFVVITKLIRVYSLVGQTTPAFKLGWKFCECTLHCCDIIVRDQIHPEPDELLVPATLDVSRTTFCHYDAQAENKTADPVKAGNNQQPLLTYFRQSA